MPITCTGDVNVYPVAGYQDNALALWPIYPAFLRGLFIDSFTSGLRDPVHGRVRETSWRLAMSKLRDSVFYCSSCASENFFDVAALQAAGGAAGACWSCGTSLQLPPRIRIGRTVVMLNPDAQLFAHHLDDSATVASYGCEPAGT